MEGAEPSSRSAERETLDRSQAPEGVNFFRRKKEGKPQVGFPLLSLTSANSSATFSFDTKGAKEKVIKKKTPGFVSPPAGGDQGSAFGNRELLKKLDQNFCREKRRSFFVAGGEEACAASTRASF